MTISYVKIHKPRLGCITAYPHMLTAHSGSLQGSQKQGLPAAAPHCKHILRLITDPKETDIQTWSLLNVSLSTLIMWKSRKTNQCCRKPQTYIEPPTDQCSFFLSAILLSFTFPSTYSSAAHNFCHKCQVFL